MTEHHFLTEYSHLSANEVVLRYLAAVTSRIRLLSGILNISPVVNHSIRVAEQVAMLDHLSDSSDDPWGHGATPKVAPGMRFTQANARHSSYGCAIRGLLLPLFPRFVKYKYLAQVVRDRLCWADAPAWKGARSLSSR